MAYAKPIPVVRCSERSCTKVATYEVYNQRNELMRACCHGHAEDLVRRLSADEEARR